MKRLLSFLMIAAIALGLGACQTTAKRSEPVSAATQAEIIALLTSGDGVWVANNEGYKRTFVFEKDNSGQLLAKMVAGERASSVKSVTVEIKGGEVVIVFVDGRGKHTQTSNLKGNRFVGHASGPTSKIGGSYMHSLNMTKMGDV